MSRIDWLEIDGRRVTEDQVKRITEYKCDVCGEFVAEPVILQVQLFAWQGFAAGLPQYYLHPGCTVKQMPFIVADLEKQGVRL